MSAQTIGLPRHAFSEVIAEGSLERAPEGYGVQPLVTRESETPSHPATREPGR